MSEQLSYGELLELKRWNTPTIYNGWGQITNCDMARDGFNLEPTCDYMPQMGPMIGYAVTIVVQPSNPEHSENNPDGWAQCRQYIASAAGPKIVVVQDLDKPNTYGAFWGECNANIHRALGCVGTITDGAIRDVDEMCNAGFKAIARQMCVGHSHSFPVRWDCEVEVFGRKIQSGQLIHADKHGFLVVPKEDEARLLEAAKFMDSNECATKIEAARDTAGKSSEQIIDAYGKVSAKFAQNAEEKYGRKGER